MFRKEMKLYLNQRPLKKMVTNETADHNGTLDLDLHQRIQNSIFELVYM
jgi:hypothetical protein